MCDEELFVEISCGFTVQRNFNETLDRYTFHCRVGVMLQSMEQINRERQRETTTEQR